MRRYWMFLLIGMLTFSWSCGDSEDTIPSLDDEERLEALLDKSDSDIVSFKDTYGTYILYDFDQLLDFAYQFQEASAWRTAKLTYLEKADVPGAVSFLKSHFLACYADTVKLNLFPRKFLICSKVYASALGISTTDENTREYHDAAANINSFTVAGLDRATLAGLSEERLDAYRKQVHYMFLAGYVLNVRRHVFVENLFFDPSSKLYGTEIKRNDQVLTDDYFMSRGFFFLPADVNYYPQQLEDLTSFVEHLVKMDAVTRDKVMAWSVMRTKMQFVARGLRAMGVDIVAVNPLAGAFL